MKGLLLALRILRKNPVFAAIAVLTIALGMGASTAIFSVTNAVLLQPLPDYKDPGRLLIAGADLRKRNVHDIAFSNADFIDLREGTQGQFSDMAAVETFKMVVPRENGVPEQIAAAVVTSNFFDVMGSRVLYGRDFTPADGTPQTTAPPATAGGPPPPPAPQMAILSYEYFMRRYGGNRAILGHSMQFTGRPGPIVVGVMEPGFRLYFPPSISEQAAPDLWVANRLSYDAANRNAFGLWPIGRLKDGVSVEQARSGADAVAAEGRRTIPLDKSMDYRITLDPLQAHMVAEARPAILALMGSVIFLLLIACANVANLLLVRASLREHEFAVRAAIGASRWRLIQPLLTEALVLAAPGTALGLALAWAGVQELRHLAPANLPRLDAIGIDGQVLGFTVLAGMVAAALFGLLPAWRASRPELMNVLRGSSRTSGLASGATLRNAVVVAEVALSFVLLIGSGLMFRSFLELERVDPGFDPHRLLTFQIAVPPQIFRKQPEERAAYLRQIDEKLGAIPGVQAVTASYPFPLTGDFSPIRWGLGDALQDNSKYQATDWQIVLPGYFETMKTPLLAGRTFTEDDNLPGRDRVVIDSALAKKAFGTESAVGKRILIRLRTPEPEWVEVIGVVAHQNQDSLTEPGREQVYFTDAFIGAGVVRTFALRTASEPANYENEARAAIASVDAKILITEMQTGDTIIHTAQGGTRFSLLLIGLFAVIAGVLAGVGLYGVLATAVRQRTSEIGVRMAMGAERGDIVKLVVMQGMRLSVVGIVLGFIAAVALGRVMTSMLVGVKATDPLTYMSMIVIFLVIAMVASWMPAWRAAGLDPKTALHEN
jgi:putative ABC transport system permease protein